MTSHQTIYHVPASLSCHSCPMKNQLKPGMDYAESPCSACPLKKDIQVQQKQIIQDNHQAERLIRFINRMLSVVHSSKRRSILFIMLRNPGIRDRQIAEKLDLPRRNVSYHTRIIRQTLPELLKGKPYHV